VRFRWNTWNIGHIGTHQVDPTEAEAIVRRARQPYPLWRPDEKWLVWGAGRGGRLLQVVFVIDEENAVYVIHARPLTLREKARYRRRKRK